MSRCARATTLPRVIERIARAAIAARNLSACPRRPPRRPERGRARTPPWGRPTGRACGSRHALVHVRGPGVKRGERDLETEPHEEEQRPKGPPGSRPGPGRARPSSRSCRRRRRAARCRKACRRSRRRPSGSTSGRLPRKLGRRGKSRQDVNDSESVSRPMKTRSRSSPRVIRENPRCPQSSGA